jgi:DNA polymerase-3 subunit delta'
MSWGRVRGHDRLIDGFDRVYRRGRLAHAYLFVGPEGVGKRLFARELAKALLCERRPDDGPLAACEQCEACLLVDAGTHPDFFAVARPEEKNELPIDVMQELCRGFALKTARGKGKVAVLDDADDLNEESSNCFLKTLEEPPPRSVFILIGTGSDQQLPTIRSRCQTVRFAPLPAPVVRDILAAGGVTDPARLDRLVRLSAGSPGAALGLADDALWDFRRELLQGLAEPRVDSVALGRRLVEFVEDAGKEGSLQRRRAALVLRLLVEALTDALAAHVGTPPRSTDPDEAALLRAILKRAGTDKILLLLERCLETEIQLNRYIQVALVLEGLIDALGQMLDEPVRT